MLYLTLGAMAKLFAPILAFTCNEIWLAMPHRAADDPRNILLNQMDQPFEAYHLDADKMETWRTAIALRQDVNGVLELARADKRIGKALEAQVTLKADDSQAEAVLKAVEGMNLKDLFIVSAVDFGEAPADAVTGRGGNFPGLQVSVSNAPVTQSVAQRAGFFSGTTDGYERILTVQTVSNISVSDYDEITRMKPEAPSGTLGRLITSPQWYYVCEVSRADLAGCKVGDWLSVEFAFDVYEPLRMRVERISDPVEERQILVLSCEDHMEEAARLRTQQADIILHTYQGVRVPKQAIYFDNDTGTAGVYVLVGAMARWKSVEIIYEAQDYYLVRQDNSNTSNLWAGDEIILTKQEITDGKVME